MRVIVAAIFILFSLAAHSQELRNHFDVPGRIENNILFNFWQNPALTGYEERSNIQGGYSMKWLGLYDSPSDKKNKITSPQNWFAAYDVAIGKSRSNSIGIIFNHTRNPFDKKSELLFSYSARFRIRKINHVRIGLSTSYVQTRVDWSKLSFPDMIDPRWGFIYSTNEIGPNAPTRNYIDFSAGLWFSRKHLFLGFSALHLTQPDNAIFGAGRVPMQLFYNAGYHFRLTPKIYLTPSVIIMSRQSLYYFQPNISLSYKNRYLVLLNYRNLNTLMINGGAQLKENLRLSIGWGFPTEKELRAIQSGQSFEIMLRYRFKVRKDETPEEKMKITK